MRRMKLMGCCFVVALFAVSAFSTATALASSFEAHNGSESPYPALVVGPETTQEFFLGPWEKFQCASPFGARLSETSSSLNTGYLQCRTTAFLRFFNANNCEITLHTGTEISEGKYSGTLDIGGPKCTKMTQETFSPTCKSSIPAQSGVPGVTFENVSGSPHKVKASFQITTLTYVIEGGDPGCGSEGTHSDGKWLGGWTLSADNEAGEPIDLSDVLKPTGIHKEGESFTADAYPASVHGNQSTSLSFQASSGVGAITCEREHFNSVLSGAASTMFLSPEFGGCIDSLGRTVEIAKYTCKYVISAAGTGGISCSEGRLEFRVRTGSGGIACTITAATQEGLSGVGYTAIGSGSESGLQVEFKLTGITTMTEGGLLSCGTKNGTHTDGTLSGNVQLFGGL